MLHYNIFCLTFINFCYQIKFFLGDPIEFVSWLLNTLHYALCSGKRKEKSIVHETFQGEMKIYTRKLPPPTEVRPLLIRVTW